MSEIVVAQNLNEASLLLDCYRTLDPKHREVFDRYYIPRPEAKDTELIQESKRARKSERPFHWFFTGHTGSGKSTELNRLRDNRELTQNYVPLYIDFTEGIPETRIVEIDYTEVILEMAVACVSTAEKLGCTFSKDLADYVAKWGKDVQIEKTVYTETEGQAGIKLDGWFGWLREQIKSGGKTREVFRESLYKDVNRFIELLNEVVKELEVFFGKKALVIIDGLDHLEVATCEELFTRYYLTLSRPQLSKLFIVPLYLLNTRFRSTIQGQCSTLANIKVFSGPKADDLDPDGFRFYEDLVSRYVPLDFFEPDALESLFRLSAGLVRDMIRLTADACGRAHAARQDKVAVEHVEQVWYQEMKYFQDVLQVPHYPLLERIEEDPNPKGLDELATLIFLKAVVRYPNGLGWYGVHPAVRRFIKER
jgi:hypothetical protein